MLSVDYRFPRLVRGGERGAAGGGARQFYSSTRSNIRSIQTSSGHPCRARRSTLPHWTPLWYRAGVVSLSSVDCGVEAEPPE